ncbi:hypothetical protein LTR70_004845 [Exophiala xenobiotica]|uniref:Conidiation protein 6 n=1 Tax=Lithohypha guttulata TaxID=1690604 RepID=A0ABR0KBU7_9EURO|nr:hypothetical protein LTR24_004463 [Lithohypha guttulata]KAK5319800.1 hypothetical protein LTR70_004845 [Exophiala xenobiotica]
MDTENTRSGKAEERILGDKATGEIDADPDHLANVQRGLKATLSNPNTSTKAKKDAEAKLQTLQDSIEVPTHDKNP